MKLLMVLTYYYPHWTGLTAHAVKIAEGLAARGVQVTVLTTRHKPELARDELLNGVRVIRLQPIGRFSRGMVTPALPLAAANLIPRHDLVQIHTPLPEAPLIGLLCRSLGRPMLMTHHGDLVMPPGPMNHFIQAIGYYVLLSSGYLAGAVTSYSRDYADHSRLLRHFKNKLSYVYPPADIPVPDLKAAEAWKQELGLTDKLIIGFAGRWVDEKGFDVLLEAMPQIKASCPNAHLVYAGEPNVVYDDFFQKCARLIDAVGQDLTLLGLIQGAQKMANFYALCDLFVQPSRTDMMGLVQLEAMLCGTPVVVSDIPGARVVVQETRFGQLVPPGEPRALAETIIDTVQHRERYLPTREEVRKHFSPDKSLSQYQALMDRLAARVPRPALVQEP